MADKAPRDWKELQPCIMKKDHESYGKFYQSVPNIPCMYPLSPTDSYRMKQFCFCVTLHVMTINVCDSYQGTNASRDIEFFPCFSFFFQSCKLYPGYTSYLHSIRCAHWLNLHIKHTFKFKMFPVHSSLYFTERHYSYAWTRWYAWKQCDSYNHDVFSKLILQKIAELSTIELKTRARKLKRMTLLNALTETITTAKRLRITTVLPFKRNKT